jgi:hypothetical protein
MQPKSRKKLQLLRETVRSLAQLGPAALRTIVGGISRETECHSKDQPCPEPTGTGFACPSAANHCQSGEGVATCTCATLATCECTAAAC